MYDETAQTTEAFNTGLEAGREEERKKCIEAMRTMSAKITELEDKLKIKVENDRRIAEVVEDIMSRKDAPELEECRKNCVMIDFVVNHMQAEKPYYGIVYYDKRDGCYYEGFGSYNHKIVNAYKEAYFDHWDRDYFEKQIEELEDKHWEECRQIAIYEDELKQLKKEIAEKYVKREELWAETCGYKE